MTSSRQLGILDGESPEGDDPGSNPEDGYLEVLQYLTTPDTEEWLRGKVGFRTVSDDYAVASRERAVAFLRDLLDKLDPREAPRLTVLKSLPSDPPTDLHAAIERHTCDAIEFSTKRLGQEPEYVTAPLDDAETFAKDILAMVKHAREAHAARTAQPSTP